MAVFASEARSSTRVRGAKATSKSFTCNHFITQFSYSSILKAAEFFKVNVIVVIDHERMYADLSKDLPKTIKIVHAPKSGGAEALSLTQEKDCQRDLIHRYFYGTRFVQLYPRFYEFTYDCPLDQLELRVVRIGVEALPSSCLPYGMNADENQTMVLFLLVNNYDCFRSNTLNSRLH